MMEIIKLHYEVNRNSESWRDAERKKAKEQIMLGNRSRYEKDE